MKDQMTSRTLLLNLAGDVTETRKVTDPTAVAVIQAVALVEISESLEKIARRGLPT